MKIYKEMTNENAIVKQESLILTYFPPSQRMNQGHFIMGSHERIKTELELSQKKKKQKKTPGPIGIPFCGCLRF